MIPVLGQVEGNMFSYGPVEVIVLQVTTMSQHTSPKSRLTCPSHI